MHWEEGRTQRAPTKAPLLGALRIPEDQLVLTLKASLQRSHSGPQENEPAESVWRKIFKPASTEAAPMVCLAERFFKATLNRWLRKKTDFK